VRPRERRSAAGMQLRCSRAAASLLRRRANCLWGKCAVVTCPALLRLLRDPAWATSVSPWRWQAPGTESAAGSAPAPPRSLGHRVGHQQCQMLQAVRRPLSKTAGAPARTGTSAATSRGSRSNEQLWSRGNTPLKTWWGLKNSVKAAGEKVSPWASARKTRWQNTAHFQTKRKRLPPATVARVVRFCFSG
jgi:hypothetical protein